MAVARTMICASLALAGSIALIPAASTVYPVSTGTVEYYPMLGVIQMPVGDTIQSTCSQTTSTNLSWRRGFIEFVAPIIRGNGGKRATLVIQDQGGTYAPPVPPVVHRVLYYPADLAVGNGDFNAAAIEWATFETDPNENPKTYRIDITSLIREFAGQPIGFRIQMAVDPDGLCPFPGGTGFGSFSNNPPFIEVRK
jgi:hypothetical protein